MYPPPRTRLPSPVLTSSLPNHQHGGVHASHFSAAHATQQVLSTSRCLLDLSRPPKADPPTTALGTTAAAGIDMSPDLSLSPEGGARASEGVVEIQVDPSRPSTRRPLRCVAGCSPTTTKLTLHTPTQIDTAGGSGYAQVPNLKWGT